MRRARVATHDIGVYSAHIYSTQHMARPLSANTLKEPLIMDKPALIRFGGVRANHG
jgi:hypothetical protein